LGGTIAVMGSRVIGYTSAGALGCVTTAFIARIGWRREETRLTPQQLQAQQIVSILCTGHYLWAILDENGIMNNDGDLMQNNIGLNMGFHSKSPS